MKTLVIASATFLEMVRRPLFWGIFTVTTVLLVSFIFIPYFTLGEETKMTKDQGLAVNLVASLILALFAASVSIAEEIEGKTAITLLSKPIRRRDFILGKYFGILAGTGLLYGLLSIVFLATIYYKLGYDAIESLQDRLPTAGERFAELWGMVPVIVLIFCTIAMLTALSVAFSTRFPVHWNITLSIMIFALGNLAPQVVAASEGAGQGQGKFEAVVFLAKLFAAILPGLHFFNMGPAIATDTVVPWLDYVLPALVYCILYSGIALVLALLMFEDRDLA